MFRFFKKCFLYSNDNFWLLYVKCKYIKVCFNENQECKMRKKVIDINNNDPTFYHFSISVDKCSGNCININDPYAKLCVPDVAVFNKCQSIQSNVKK